MQDEHGDVPARTVIVLADGPDALDHLTLELQPGVRAIDRLWIVAEKSGYTRLCIVVSETAAPKLLVLQREGRLPRATQIVIDYDMVGERHALSLLWEFRDQDALVVPSYAYLTDVSELDELRSNVVGILASSSACVVDGAERLFSDGPYFVGAVRVHECPRFWSIMARDDGEPTLLDGLRALPNDLVEIFDKGGTSWGRLDPANVGLAKRLDERTFQRW